MTDIWDAYARVYDAVRVLSPYSEMMDYVSSRIGPAPCRILDYGCGTGNLLERIPCGSVVCCVDDSSVMLSRTAKKASAGPLSTRFDGVVILSAREFWASQETDFDVVTAVNVLYALPAPRVWLQDISARLKPGGRIVVVNPHDESTMFPILKQSLRDQGVTHHLRALPKLLPLWLVNMVIQGERWRGRYSFVAAEEIIRDMEQCGFELISARRCYSGTCVCVEGLRL